MTPEEMKQIITETLARFETHFREPEKVLEFVHDDIDWTIMGSSATSGRRNRAEMVEMLVAFPNYTDNGMRIWPTSFIIEGDKVAAEGELTMTLKDGRHYSNRYHWMFEFRDGKIVCVREYLDTAHAAEIFG